MILCVKETDVSMALNDRWGLYTHCRSQKTSLCDGPICSSFFYKYVLWYIGHNYWSTEYSIKSVKLPIVQNLLTK